ncbi:MAG: HD domain-containing protein [Actinomycetota bacterium]|nr:HD domain-containing protein [Actinomycetota bacterium]
MGYSEQGSISVLIAEKHRAVAQSLEKVVDGLGIGDVAAQAHTADDALEAATALCPDIALVDLDLSPTCNLVTSIHRRCPSTKIIVMGEPSDKDGAALVRALESGATAAIYKGGSVDEFLRALDSSPSAPVVADDAAGVLLRSYMESMEEKRKRDLATIEALAGAVDARDSVTGSHQVRVTQLATETLAKIDPSLARNEEVCFGFMLHDIGKIGIPDAILNKPGPLDGAEWSVMRNHPELGVRIVEPIGFSKSATEIILTHHERWDGRGYPLGLEKEEIPLTSRAFSVADAYDAMTSDRPYRPAMEPADALDVIRQSAGSLYDPAVVDLFEEVVA